MNVVLLSGGSGKRLWPLSNEVRSKQFIRLFDNGEGQYESMAERVHRQLKKALGDARIVVATGKGQASALRNQLGGQVSICVEPCRRDTFPAIALAAAYLKHEMNASDEECVVICPVDSYVADEYYESFLKLESLVMNGQANLTLMGIEPTGPSDKYGYIIPETGEAVSRVASFKEKPDTEKAREFIHQGALWNAGVFALRLGYLLKRAHELIEFTDYQDLYGKYEALKRISFDYAVVEMEKEIQVLRYSGQWKDIGTWSTITEAMDSTVVGNVALDETCDDVRAINELGIPMLIMGGKNMIVAASPDGILIADREKSGGMKPYVEKFEGNTRFAEKSWGTYTVLDEQPGMLTARIELAGGQRFSYHEHEKRQEVWTVISGEGEAVIDGEAKSLFPGDCLIIPAGQSHMLHAHTAMILIEVQTGSEISAQDKRKRELP